MPAIQVDRLTKVYGGRFKAVDEISFAVEEGEIFGLLGPNGAGKTTTIRVITTMTKPTSGSVSVIGTDVLKHPAEVRQVLGYVPQAVSVDGDLSASENLLIFSKLFYVSKKDREDRIKFAIDYMGLSERADDLVKHFSGGMMRRLEIAQALVNRPRIMILDEPSIGLDPGSKRQMWKYIKELNSEFQTTVLITTHDMVEADELCDRVAIMHSGKISVIGDPAELKRSVGGEILTVGLKLPKTKILPIEETLDPIASITIPQELGSIASREGSTLKIVTENGERAIPRITDYFERLGVTVDSISLSKPSLDDVFIKYGKSLESESVGMYQEARTTRRAIASHSR
jgi:ABC-2 type transport system ATP-binding protein